MGTISLLIAIRRLTLYGTPDVLFEGWSCLTLDRGFGWRSLPALYLSMFWIGPWYGFLHAPVFLAQVIFYPCEESALSTRALAVAAMVMTHVIGRRLAEWLFSARRGNRWRQH